MDFGAGVQFRIPVRAAEPLNHGRPGSEFRKHDGGGHINPRLDGLGRDDDLILAAGIQHPLKLAFAVGSAEARVDEGKFRHRATAAGELFLECRVKLAGPGNPVQDQQSHRAGDVGAENLFGQPRDVDANLSGRRRLGTHAGPVETLGGSR